MGALGLGVAATAAITALVLLGPAAEPPTVAGAAGPAVEAQPRADNAAARALMAEAESLLNRGDDEAALQQYARALSLYERSRDLVGQGSVSLGLAKAAHVTGQSDRARARYDEAVALFRQAGSAVNEARALVARADLEKDTFNWADADRYYREARAVWATVPEPKSDHHVLFRMEDAPQMPEGEAAAREVLKQATLIFGRLDDLELLGDVSSLLAALNWNVGLRGFSRTDYGIAEELYRRAGVPLKEGGAALEGARIDILFGQNIQARRALDLAIDLFAGAADDAGTALARLAEGDLERLQGRMPEARAAYAAALGPLRAADHPEAATVLLKLGQVDAYLGATEQARAELEEALDRYRSQPSVAGEAAAALELGALVMNVSGHALAPALFDTAAERFAESGNTTGAGRARLGAAGHALAQGNTDVALALYLQGAARFDEADLALGRALAALGRGDAARAAGDSAAATNAYRDAIVSFRETSSPIIEANRILGLPEVASLYVPIEAPDDVEFPDMDLASGPPEFLAAVQAEQTEKNLAQFPENNAEARALVAEVEARIRIAASYVLGQD